MPHCRRRRKRRSRSSLARAAPPLSPPPSPLRSPRTSRGLPSIPPPPMLWATRSPISCSSEAKRPLHTCVLPRRPRPLLRTSPRPLTLLLGPPRSFQGRKYCTGEQQGGRARSWFGDAHATHPQPIWRTSTRMTFDGYASKLCPIHLKTSSIAPVGGKRSKHVWKPQIRKIQNTSFSNPQAPTNTRWLSTTMTPAYLDLAKLLPSSAAIRAEALLPSPFDSP